MKSDSTVVSDNFDDVRSLDSETRWKQDECLKGLLKFAIGEALRSNRKFLAYLVGMALYELTNPEIEIAKNIQ